MSEFNKDNIIDGRKELTRILIDMSVEYFSKYRGRNNSESNKLMYEIQSLSHVIETINKSSK
jgi:hypothetical protein